MGMTEKSAESIAIIGGSDGPTSVFLARGQEKKTWKQKVQKFLYEERKKRVIRGIKPGTHTMQEVVELLKERYGFTDVPQEEWEYIENYKNMRVSSIFQFAPELLGEYAALPELKSHDEEGLREFQAQWELRQQKAAEIPKEVFDIELYLLEKKDSEVRMSFEIEARFGHIGGGFNGRGNGKRRRFERLLRKVYTYYGVTQEDIDGNTKRYQTLVRMLTMRH